MTVNNIFLRRPLHLFYRGYLQSLNFYFLLRLLFEYDLWPIAFISQFIHLVMLVLVPLIFVFIALGWWYRISWLTGYLVVYLVLFGTFFLPKPMYQNPVNHETNTTVTVMTFNVGSGLISQSKLVEAVNASNADIVGLQEIAPSQVENLQEGLFEEYPYQVVARQGNWALGLLSKYPVVQQELVFVNWEHLPPYLQVKLAIDGKETTIIVFRAHSPRLGWYEREFAFHTWRGGEELVKRLQGTSSLIVLTDLNITDQSTDYEKLEAFGLIDAFRAQGAGLGLTYPARPDGWRKLPCLTPRLVRIDYVWVSKDIRVSDAWTGDSAGSDHSPVLATLVINTPFK